MLHPLSTKRSDSLSYSFFLFNSVLFHLLIVGIDGYCSILSHSVNVSGRGSALSQRPLPDNTLHVHGGIRTRHPKKRAAADLRLRPHGHWDRAVQTLIVSNFSGAEILLTQRKDISIICTKCGYLQLKKRGGMGFLYV